MRCSPKYLSLGLTTLWSCLSVDALAADIRVIANPSVKVSAISRADLKNVYLETRTLLADGSHVEPVLLKSGALYLAFVRQYVGKSGTALEIYYRSLVFTGKAMMPKALGSEEQVVEYIAKTEGAVGYVSAGVALTGVKVLDVR
jgi:hypothetical protein